MRDLPSRIGNHDDDSALILRRYCLAFHDIRAVYIELAARVDIMKNIFLLKPYRRQVDRLV